MINLFNTYLYNPILWVLVFIHQNISFGDLGVAIIILTVLVRLVLFPIFYKGVKDQALMTALQPHVKKIQLDHKDNKEEQAKKLLELYRKHKLNPFSGFLLLLVQLPVFIVLFKIFANEITNGTFSDPMFLGLIDLSSRNLGVAVFAAGLQYAQGKLALSAQKAPAGKDNPLANMGKTMLYIAPGLTLVILSTLPSALGLYWVVSSVFSIGQQIYINKRLPDLGHTTKYEQNTKVQTYENTKNRS